MKNISKNVKIVLIAGVAALGLAASVPAASARGGVSVGIGFGGVYAPPVVYSQPCYAPAVTYYSTPAPTYYYAPAQTTTVYTAPQVVYAPAPVYYSAPPVYYYQPRYYTPFSFDLGFRFGGGRHR